MSIYIICGVLFFLISLCLSYNEYKDTERISYPSSLKLSKLGYSIDLPNSLILINSIWLMIYLNLSILVSLIVVFFFIWLQKSLVYLIILLLRHFSYKRKKVI